MKQEAGFSEVTPPSSVSVQTEARKPVLYLPDGRALVREIGFRSLTVVARTEACS